MGIKTCLAGLCLAVLAATVVDVPPVEAQTYTTQPDRPVNRAAQKRILPLAAEIKAGVLTAQPFGSGRPFRAVRGRTVPDWAKDFASSTCSQMTG